MKNLAFLIFLISALLLTGCTSQSQQAPPASTPSIISTPTIAPIRTASATPIALNSTDLKRVSGMVNLTEIGGKDLKVISANDPSSPVAVSADGSFSTIVSNKGAQLVFLSGSGGVWGSVISLPQDSQLVIDSKSTTLASVFLVSPGILNLNPQEEQQSFGIIEQQACFNQVWAFVKSKLPTMPYSKFVTSPDFINLASDCMISVSGKLQ